MKGEDPVAVSGPESIELPASIPKALMSEEPVAVAAETSMVEAVEDDPPF